MVRKINEKDVVVGAAALGLGYLLLTRKAPVEKGGAGGAGEAVKDVGGMVVDELGGLGIKTPNYTINIPGAGGGTLVFPDFPPVDAGAGFIGPDYTDPGHKYDVPFEWPKISIPKIDILNELIGVPTEDLAGFISNKELQQQVVPTVTDIMRAAFPTSGLTQFLASKIFKSPVDAPAPTTTVVKSKKGRKERVSAFRKKFDVPTDYSYPVTGTPIKVR